MGGRSRGAWAARGGVVVFNFNLYLVLLLQYILEPGGYKWDLIETSSLTLKSIT